MGTDFTVNGKRHIIPAHVTAAFLVRTVVKFHIEQGVGLQAFLSGNLIVFCFPLPKCGNGGFLCCGYDLRVVPYQRGIDTFSLHFYGFRLRCPVVADKQGRAIVKLDRYVACTAPFPGTGGSFYFARRTAESLCDNPDLILQGEIFVLFGDLNRFFL